MTKIQVDVDEEQGDIRVIVMSAKFQLENASSSLQVCLFFPFSILLMSFTERVCSNLRLTVSREVTKLRVSMV